MKWRASLRAARSVERTALEYVRAKAERLHLEEVCGALCAAAPLGLADCAHVRAFARVSRWGRKQGKLYAEIRCTSNVPGGDATLRWSFDPVSAASRSFSEIAESGS